MNIGLEIVQRLAWFGMFVAILVFAILAWDRANRNNDKLDEVITLVSA